MSSQPNMDLLKRQRTFSIDETREQLRQGRPVQREAIISGAVDYQSLMFGDDHELAMKNSRLKSSEVPSSSSAVNNNMHYNNENGTHTVPDDIIAIAKEGGSIVDSLQSSPQRKEAETPLSPQRITPSTWAAMVKSSSESSTSHLTSPSRQSSLTKQQSQSSSSVSETAAKHAKNLPLNESKPGSKNSKENKEQIEKYKEKKPFQRNDRKKKYSDDHTKSVQAENVRFSFLVKC
jgi:hypothetical protein